jgi:hypothetical protein
MYAQLAKDEARIEQEFAKEMEGCEPPESETCPHGYPWSDCNPCAIASDFAYDASRGG